jgi:hypothetical protein
MSRWHNVLDGADPISTADRTPLATGKWTADEDNQLKYVVQIYGSKNWGKIAAMLPGRKKRQCSNRWNDVLDPSIDRTLGRTGKWTADEDDLLEYAVEKHGGNNWIEIAALVPGRTIRQSMNRWHNFLDPNVKATPERTDKWSAEEDDKLKYAIRVHGSKNWIAIAALVSGRTLRQCTSRWHDALNVLDPISTDWTPRAIGERTVNEDDHLKDAVKRYGVKNWREIAAMVPGRTKRQCASQWHDILNPSVDRTPERTGKWTAVEDELLKYAVQRLGGSNWIEIATLVPGRTKRQCTNRWHDNLDPSVDRTSGRTSRSGYSSGPAGSVCRMGSMFVGRFVRNAAFSIWNFIEYILLPGMEVHLSRRGYLQLS